MMDEFENNRWTDADGFNSSGPEIRAMLEEMIAGELSGGEQVELMVELYREGVASPAGYAAVPLLIYRPAPNPRTAWHMAHTACLILGAAGKDGSPPVPPGLLETLGPDHRQAAVKAVWKSGADAGLGVPEWLDSLSAVLTVLGRADLADTVLQLALAEYGAMPSPEDR